MSSALLVARGLEKRFATARGTVFAVRGVDLSVARGASLGIVGESGSGKSTVARLVLVLIRPTAGSVSFDGADMTSLSDKALRPIRRRMQIIFQDPLGSLFPHRSVLDNVSDPLALHREGSPSERRRRAMDMLARVGIPEALHYAYPHEVSGGQQQRTAIARALIMRPELLVCDEPISSLDVSIQAQIINLLLDLREEFGLSYVLISHNLAHVALLCGEVVVMYLGKVVESGPTAEVFSRPAHPYTRALLAAIPTIGADGSTPATSMLTGEPPSPLDPPSGCAFRTRCPFVRPECAEREPALEDLGFRRSAACLRLEDGSLPIGDQRLG